MNPLWVRYASHLHFSYHKSCRNLHCLQLFFLQKRFCYLHCTIPILVNSKVIYRKYYEHYADALAHEMSLVCFALFWPKKVQFFHLVFGYYLFSVDWFWKYEKSRILKFVQVMVCLHRKDNIFARNNYIWKICKRTITWTDISGVIIYLVI